MAGSLSAAAMPANLLSRDTEPSTQVNMPNAHMFTTVTTINFTEILLAWRPIVQAMDVLLWDALSDADRAKFAKITHEGRKREWCEGRRALRELPSDCLVKSVAHSDDWAVAVGTRSNVKGIGVDLEPHDREISQRVIDWLGHDGRWTSSALETWTIKEACFKADRGQNEERVLADYVIDSPSTARTRGEPMRQFSFCLRREGTWLLALAVQE